MCFSALLLEMLDMLILLSLFPSSLTNFFSFLLYLTIVCFLAWIYFSSMVTETNKEAQSKRLHSSSVI